MALAAQPTQRAVVLTPENILMCNTSNIDSMRHGRPQTVMFEAGEIAGNALPNGTIVTLLETKEEAGKEELDHVHGIQVQEQTSVAGKFIIISPEINVEQYRRIDNMIAGHQLVAEETYTAYELVKGDRIEFSQGHLAVPGTLPIAGDLLNVDANGKLVAGGAALRVVSVRYQRLPLMMAVGGELMPEPIAMIKVEVVA